MFGLEFGEIFAILGVFGVLAFFVVVPIAIIILLVMLIRKKRTNPAQNG